MGAVHPHQICPRQIHLNDNTNGAERKIAHGREIVEVSVILQRCLPIVPRLPQLGVLPLQFNLVDLQLVEQLPRIRSGFRPANFKLLLLR